MKIQEVGYIDIWDTERVGLPTVNTGRIVVYFYTLYLNQNPIFVKNTCKNPCWQLVGLDSAGSNFFTSN